MLRLARRIAGERTARIAVLLGALFSLPGLAVGYVLDDHYHRLALAGFGLPGGPRGAWDLYRFCDGSDAFWSQVDHGPYPWWSSHDLRLAFFRPIPSLLRAAEERLFGENAWACHLVTTACFALLVWIAARAYRQLLAAPTAQPDASPGATRAASIAVAVATVAFAVDDAHSLNLSWIAARYSLIASAFAILGLLAHVRARAGLGPRWLSPLCFAVGLLCGETTLGLLGYLAAWAWFVDGARPSGRVSALRALAPHAGLFVVWAGLYKLAQYGAKGSAFYIDPIASPGAYLSAVGQRLPKLAASQLIFPPCEVFGILPLSTNVAQIVVSTLLAGLVVAAILRATRRPEATALLVGGALALLPNCATNPDDHLLLLPGFGAFGAIGLLVGEVAVVPERSAVLRLAARVLVGVHLLLAPLLLPLREITFPFMIQGLVDRGAASFPDDAAVREQDLVLVAAPDSLFTAYMFLTRQQSGAPVPRSARILTVQTGGEFTVTRVGEAVIEVENAVGQNGGPFWGLYRDTPYAVGEITRLSDMDAEVLAVDRGVPTKLRFSLHGALSTKRFMIWQGRSFTPFELPAVGASAHFVTTPLDEAMKP